VVSSPAVRHAATVSVHYIRAFASAASALGAKPEALLAEAGLTPADLRDPDARLPLDALAALWIAAPRHTGVDAFGLRMAQLTPPPAFDVVDYAMRASDHLRDAYRKALRYLRIHISAASHVVEEDGDEARLHFALSVPVPAGATRQGVVFALAAMVVRGRAVTGTGLPLVEVRFALPRPADVSEHERFFRAPVRWNAERHTLVLARSTLDLPVRSADPNLARLIDRCAQDLLEKLPSPESFLDGVRRAILEGLRGGVPTAPEIARRLGVSVRSLQRRLHDERATFQGLVDDVRRELSLRHLAGDGLSVGELTFLLGFSEPSAFHRAFRRWTGTTPAEYRRARTASATG